MTLYKLTKNEVDEFWRVADEVILQTKMTPRLTNFLNRWEARQKAISAGEIISVGRTFNSKIVDNYM